MNRFVYNKSTLQIVGKLYPHIPLDVELGLNVFPNYGGTKNDYAVIETDIEMPILIMQSGEILAIERPVPEPEPQPPSEIEVLKQENAVLQLAIAETIEKQEVDKINNQIALAEVIETLTIKGVL